MKITPALKAFLLSKGWADADTAEEDLRKIVLEKLSSGDLTATKLAELQRDPGEAGTGPLKTLVSEQVKEALQPFQAMMGSFQATLEKFSKTDPPVKEPDPPTKDDDPPTPQSMFTQEQIKELIAEQVKTHVGNSPSDVGDISPTKMLSEAVKGGETLNVRLKSAVERYDTTRKAAVIPERTRRGTIQPNAGMPAIYDGKQLEHPSELDKAVSGAVFKWHLNCSTSKNLLPRSLHMTEHDQQVVQWALRNVPWTGIINPTDDGLGGKAIHGVRLSELEIKALLDDSTSGGLEIVPIIFDEAIIVTPILFGELFPLVNVINIPRGRRIEGAAVGRPSIGSGPAEGTAITPFDTTGFVTAFDTTIYNATGAMEIGEDFLEDSPANIGQWIITAYGEELMRWLDEQIAVGDGTTEPQGIFVAAGTTAVNSDNSTAGPPTVSDFEGLVFGLSKPFRNAKGGRNVFIANDVTFRRGRGIAVSGTDQRRIFGMDLSRYEMFGIPFKIQGDIPNNQIAFVNMGYYRMYRRLGMTIRVETGGNYLALRNLRLITVRSRWGGRLELGGAAAVMSDMQS